MNSVRIIKCVCHGTRFSELKKISEKTGARTIPALQRHAPFATNCKRCVPYVNEMLRTGKTEFHELLEPNTDPHQNTEPGATYGDESEL
ncbi:MAG TPA: (2Fe-2S)-binding protein [candidate division Zixibacteria bacterium]|nr:(2Fe-2S)-binding protein [candidate division Zixibacteria bacterium]